MSRLTHWFQSLGRTAKAKPHGFRPRLEMLEDRTVLSTLTVMNNLDSGVGSLRAAITAANSGDTIVFAPAVHAITLTSGELDITKSLTINGPGANTLSISGNDASRVFDVGPASGSIKVAISGLTITQGKEIVTTEGDGGGGILNVTGSTLTLQADVVSDCLATASAYGVDVLGGGLLNTGSVSIQSCTFTDDQATGGGGSGTFAGGSAGGAVDNEGGTLVVQSSTFTKNEVNSAAVAVSGTYNFATGGALMSEGGVINHTTATATISNSSFSQNLATGGDSVTGEAGGICCQSAVGATPGLATMTINNCQVTGNQAIGGPDGNGGAYSEGIGGGILNAGTITINNSTIANNEAMGGTGSVPSVGGFANPATGAGQGGGINDDTGIMTINNCTVKDNEAIGANTAAGPGCIATGGGIDCWGVALAFPGILHINNSTITGNQAIAGAGGPGASAPQIGFAAGAGLDAAFSAVVTVSNSTVTDNKATGSAGGSGVNGGAAVGAGIDLGFSAIFSTAATPVVDNTTLQLTNTTVSGNVATGGTAGTGADGGPALGGGLAINLGCSATVVSSTIKDNTANGSQTSSAQANGGGGIDNAGTLSLKGCTVSSNQAVTTAGNDALGGGLLNNEGQATIQGTLFAGNLAKGGGSADFFAGSTGGAIDNYEGATLDVTSSQFNANEAISAADATGDFFYATGGAIEEDAGIINNNPSKATITNSSFTNNLVTGGAGVDGNGGGIDIQSMNANTPGLVILTLIGCTVTGNRSVGGGGGDGVNTGDSEGVGGGVMSGKGTLNITNCLIANNQAIGGNGATISAADPYAGSGFGGGISNNDSGFTPGTQGVNATPTDIGSLVISHSTISGNIVQGGNTTTGPGGNALGGGVSNSPLGNMTMTDCTVVDNQAKGGTGSVTSAAGNGSGSGAGSGTVQGGFAFGAGVDTSNQGSSATFINCTITGNSAVGGAGAQGNVGGNGYGGGLGVGWGAFLGYPTDGSTITLIDSDLANNFAQGGVGGAGANGGSGEGGGLFIGPTASATLYDSQVESNSALAGAKGKGGSAGAGVGGGVYNDNTSGTSFNEDLLTVLAHNIASTSNGNLFQKP